MDNITLYAGRGLHLFASEPSCPKRGRFFAKGSVATGITLQRRRLCNLPYGRFFRNIICAPLTVCTSCRCVAYNYHHHHHHHHHHHPSPSPHQGPTRAAGFTEAGLSNEKQGPVQRLFREYKEVKSYPVMWA